jgi:hypothetical protein
VQSKLASNQRKKSLHHILQTLILAGYDGPH